MTNKHNVRSFVNNINKVAEHLPVIKKVDRLLTPEALTVLEDASEAGFQEIIKDLAKGATDAGARKLDIDLRLNTKRELRHVTYDHMYVLVYSPVEEKVVKWHYDFSQTVSQVHELYDELRLGLEAAKPTFFDELTGRQYLDNLAIELVDGVGGPNQLIRLTDTGEGQTSPLIGICVVSSEGCIDCIDPFSTYVWAGTSSGLATGAMNLQSINSLSLTAERKLQEVRNQNAASSVILDNVLQAADSAYADISTDVNNITLAVNSDAEAWVDRLGVERPTLKRLERDFPQAGIDADRAEAAKGVAVDAKVVAENARVASLGAAARAEAASDAAFVNADVYPDVAAGLGATPNNGQFQVLAPNTVEFIRYENNSGTAAEVGRFPNTQLVYAAYRDAVSTFKNAVLSYPLPMALPISKGGVSPMVLSSGATFANGDEGVGVYTQNGQLVSAEAMVELSRNHGDITVITVEFQKTSSSASNVGFGVARHDLTGPTGIIYRDDGSLFYALPDGLTVPSEFYDSTKAYVTGDRVALELTYTASSGEYAARIIKNGEASLPVILDQFPESGTLGFAVRGSGVDGILRVVKRVGSDEDVLGNVDLSYLDKQAETSTQVGQFKWGTPSSLPTILGSGTVPIQVSGEGRFLGEHYALQIDATGSLGADRLGAVQLGDGLLSGGIVRMSATYIATTGSYTPALGLGFGSEEDYAKGFGIRSTAQLINMIVHANIVNSVTGTTPPTFSIGDRITLDARLAGGSLGNYTVRYYLEYPDGARYGPYDVEGVESVSHTWFMCRSSSLWGDVETTLHKAPLYADELISVEGPQPPAPAEVVYVAPAPLGSDSNLGTKAAPMATLNAAWARLDGGGVIELAEGEYRGLVLLDGISSHLEVRAEPYKRATILGSVQMEVTKSLGYTQVYQAPLAEKPILTGPSRGPAMIFEWGTPSKPIPPEEYHSMYRGQAFRLPYTEMYEAESIGELDTPEGLGKWYWEDGTIYLTAVDGGDASLGRYEARATPTLLVVNGSSLTTRRLDIFFSQGNGVRSGGLGKYFREDCRAFGHRLEGFKDDATIGESIRDEAGGNGNDGVNGHAQTGWMDTPNRGGTYGWIYRDLWSHDNYDDAHSFHERGECSIYGGLLEYSGKAGCVQVAGAAVTCYNTIARRNPNGFYSSTPPLDTRAYTSLVLHGCIAAHNGYNFRASNPNCDIIAYNCTSQEAGTWGYSSDNGGKLLAYNSRHGGDPAKAKSGNVIVVNDAMLD